MRQGFSIACLAVAAFLALIGLIVLLAGSAAPGLLLLLLAGAHALVGLAVRPRGV